LENQNQWTLRTIKLKISVTVTLKKDVLDPQGKVVSQTIKNMGYNNVTSVRQGKYFEIEIDENNKDEAKKNVQEICEKLLANLIIEDFVINFK
jgi:phosphoribosylformylglycinamidine synthase subunit PurS